MFIAVGRTLWVDVLKGIAIILVVIGHNGSHISSDFIACFHMPLFFLLSGWLFSPKQVKKYAKKSAIRLLFPYICFLFIASFPQLVAFVTAGNTGGGKSLIKSVLYGGFYLQGIYAVFWFITVLWMSSNIFNLIVSKQIKNSWLPVLIILAYVAYLTPKPLPWNIHIVPMATAYLWIGFLLRQQEDKLRNVILAHKIVTTVFVLSTLTLVFFFRESLTFSMKYAETGIPIISLVVSVVASICVALIAIWLTKWPVLGKALSFVGLASMAIMYLHMPIKFYLTLKIAPVEAYGIHIFCSIFFSLIAFYLMNKTKVTRKYLLGEQNVY